MSPCFPSGYFMGCGSRDSINSTYRPKGFPFIRHGSYFKDFIIGEFGQTIGFPLMNLFVPKSHFYGMVGVFSTCDPFKIFPVITVLVSILVIYLKIFLFGRNKGFGDYFVNGHALVWAVKVNCVITLLAYKRLQVLTIHPLILSMKNAANFPGFRDFIQPLPSNYRLPNLFAIIKRIHDRLSYQSVFWLEPMRVLIHSLGSFILPLETR